MVWRSVPWQGRQSALVMAAAMPALAVANGAPGAGLLLGAVLLLSAMAGTIGVRGTPSAAMCCHRALVSLVMAVCAFDGAGAGDSVAAGASEHAHGGMTGVLPVLAVVGVVAVVLWTVVSEWVLAPVHQGRTARLLAVESWAMAAGVAVMCVGF
ncbi:hypothetical protein [Microbacterium sp. SD291]|uniref:hypothetical protein n=1 Tax=Microbacterium sp. SD291 TaxID=2782007 RepID=UPI001A965773|nr:hypothetical protein [Microbacterium sp. SD291]MBO0980127.1 hypothetical protein [Microbacterium sp. SD291]